MAQLHACCSRSRWTAFLAAQLFWTIGFLGECCGSNLGSSGLPPSSLVELDRRPGGHGNGCLAIGAGGTTSLYCYTCGRWRGSTASILRPLGSSSSAASCSLGSTSSTQFLGRLATTPTISSTRTRPTSDRWEPNLSRTLVDHWHLADTSEYKSHESSVGPKFLAMGFVARAGGEDFTRGHGYPSCLRLHWGSNNYSPRCGGPPQQVVQIVNSFSHSRWNPYSLRSSQLMDRQCGMPILQGSPSGFETSSIAA